MLNHLKGFILFILFSTAFTGQNMAQEVGISFSYFLPQNGSFSAPISPFSFRGVGVDLNQFFALETGFTLYRMSGLGVKEVPFDNSESMVGPTFTVLVPVELVLQFAGNGQEIRFKAGGFGFHNFASRLNEGNLDRALRDLEGWDVANSDFEFDNNIGLGFHFGVEYIFYLNNQFGISLEGNYFIGDADLDLRGSYTGGPISGPLQTVEADYGDSQIDFTGLEISIGLLFSN
ncbi:MAG: hypothetical protein AAFX87_31105 [Bacteroidota bacterium]